jgi:hypothetical protein
VISDWGHAVLLAQDLDNPAGLPTCPQSGVTTTAMTNNHPDYIYTLDWTQQTKKNFPLDSSKFTFNALRQITKVATHYQPHHRIKKLHQTRRVRPTREGDERPARVRLEIEGYGRRSHGVGAVRDPARGQVVGKLLLDYPESLVAPTEATARANWFCRDLRDLERPRIPPHLMLDVRKALKSLIGRPRYGEPFL